MKLQPLGERVVIKPSAAEEKKYGSIIIPDTAKEKPQTGEVVAVGTDEEMLKHIQVGDTVIYAKYGGTEIKIEGEEMIILRESDILAVKTKKSK